jgi:phosphatidylserine decarboxylase
MLLYWFDVVNALNYTVEPLYSALHFKARKIIHIFPFPIKLSKLYLFTGFISFTMAENFLQIVNDLKNFIDTTEGAKENFEKAIETAFDPAKGAPDQMRDYGILSLDGFYKYLCDFVFWVPHENTTGTEPYVRMCLMYFIFEQDSVRDYQTALAPENARLPRVELSPISQWLVKFAQLQGSFLNSPSSFNDQTLGTFEAVKTDHHSYRVDDYIKPDNGWTSFNDFFSRTVKPEKRPIAGEGDDTIVASPADCRYGGYEQIDEDGKVLLEPINLKGVPWPIKDLIASCGVPEGTFDNGVLIHSFLAPFDYHRFHAPVSGTVVVSKVIPAQVYLEVKGNGSKTVPIRRPYRRQRNYKGVDAPDDPGYQWCQTRGVLVLKTEKYGYVAALPVGMCQVSSVTMTAEVNEKLTKGDEFGYFQFGGSDMVLLFEKNANFKYTGGKDQKFDMGQEFGTLGS